MSEKIDPKNLIMLDEMAIYNCLNKIIREINLHSFKPEVVVGVQRGGLIPAVQLSHYYEVPLQTVSVSFRDQSNVVGLDVLAKMDPNKKTLVIDDINDSGKTFNYIKNRNKTNTNVLYCSLVDNMNSDFQTNFWGIELDKKEEQWVVFPWENWWSGL